MQTPDKWILVKVTTEDKEVLYKILAGWYGGYTTGDSWKLNSGIESVEEFPEYYLVKGFSGSIYRCFKNSEGLSVYTNSIYTYYKTQLKTINCKFEEKPMKKYKGIKWSLHHTTPTQD